MAAYEAGSVRRCDPDNALFNYGPGPAPMPGQVLAAVQRDLLDYNGTGISVLSMSHRSPEFTRIKDEAIGAVRRVLGVPESHEVVFLHGGGHGCFAALPLNLMDGENDWAAYLKSGTWTARAFEEARKYGNVKYIDNVDLHTKAKYVYMCSNETVNGSQIRAFPRLESSNLVVDMSSDIASHVVDWSCVDVGFACTPKNIGHPGLTVLIIRQDLLTTGSPQKICPGVLDWRLMFESKSVWNTPATFNIYTTKLVCEWIEKEGGLEEMERRAILKSDLLYSMIDASSGFYTTPFAKGDTKRSRMNIPFAIRDESSDSVLTERFLKLAFSKNIVGLLTLTPFGYGKYLRASMYNHVTIEMAHYLCSFMESFRKAILEEEEEEEEGKKEKNL